MKSKALIVKRLIEEIHQLCVQNKIEYFLTENLALLAYRNIDISDTEIDSGAILMTAENLEKFIICGEENLKENRVIEWMGNNGAFPGLFARYVDISTTYYTHERLICEKHLGMFVTVQLLRPKSKFDICYQSWEKSYENIAKGVNPTGKKLEPVFRKRLAKKIRKNGRETVAKEIACTLIKKYSRLTGCREYWTKDINNRILYFSSSFFSRCVLTKVGDIELYVSGENEKLLKRIYGKRQYKDKCIEFAENSMMFFCDSEIPYTDLHLDSYVHTIKDIFIYEDKIKKKIRPYKKKKEKMIDNLFRIYYKYYFGIKLMDNIDKLELMYSEGESEKLKEIFLPYIEAMEEYGVIYIDERISSLVERLYSIEMGGIFKNVPDSEKIGLPLYNYRGEYLRTIGGQDNGCTSGKAV